MPIAELPLILLFREPIAELTLISYSEIRTTVFGYYHTESEAMPSLIPVYKEWLIPPEYNGLLLTPFSQPTMLACQVSSPYLTSFPLSVLLVVTTQCPRLRECKLPLWHFTFDTRRGQALVCVQERGSWAV